MITEKVYSPIWDSIMVSNPKTLPNSPIWKECYKEDEEKSNVELYEYIIKFDGLKSIQLLSPPRKMK